jgi:nucleoside-diphosphate-sugar epimerase
VINIGGGRPKTVNQVLAEVSRSIGEWIEPLKTEKRIGDVRHTRADISRAKELLEWTPKADWQRAVDETVQWFLSRKKADADSVLD